MTFAALLAGDELLAAVSDDAWVRAMLQAEAALARAEADAGVVPPAAAAAIEQACAAGGFDAGELAVQGRASGNPAEPLVRALRARVGGEAAGFVHHGATSQDIVDSAAMLVARQALVLVERELEGAAAACERLARRHRDTPMIARTLLQQAVPTTFGLKAAGWLDGLLDACELLRDVRERGLAAQLGGAAGTLAALGEHGLDVASRFAAAVELPEPPLPWHANRSRIARLGGALDVAAGVAAKIALDLALLGQTEVGEVREPGGGSSTMPHKQNPTGSVRARAAARQARAAAAVLLAAGEGEHERSAGAWQAEWSALSAALALTGGAAEAVRGALEGLQVDAAAMRRNLDLTGGQVLAERVVFVLAERLGRERAQQLVQDAASRGGSLREALGAHGRTGLSEAELDALLDPAGYLGAAGALVDRALARRPSASPG